MVYCMSDIHGEIDRFRAMLDMIRFSKLDTLYVIGDIIDRKPAGVDILKIIMDSPNMVMLLGNHEKMCIDTLGPMYVYGARELWKQNGGSSTYRELLYLCSKQEKNKVLKFLTSLPDHLDIEVGGRKFHLVHGFPADNTDDRVWNRPPFPPPEDPPVPGVTCIVGHTPVLYLDDRYKDGEEPLHIWHGNGIIDLDCGCGNETPRRRLACLRLDDMEEFYT